MARTGLAVLRYTLDSQSLFWDTLNTSSPLCLSVKEYLEGTGKAASFWHLFWLLQFHAWGSYLGKSSHDTPASRNFIF